jgi:hypothetical protein
VTCQPAGAADEPACARSIIGSFGARAWRRPLQGPEIDRLAKVASDARALGEDFAGSVRQVVRTMLASVPFLYRVEMDARPDSLDIHPLDGYELASRLSYLQWSTMPDEELFRLAASGELLKPEVLSAQVDRLLVDRRGEAFINGFAGQWLGLRALQGHQVEATAFPEWDEPLRQAMTAEGYLYFADFLRADRSLQQFFTADINFVNARLARHYGLPPGAPEQPVRIEERSDKRKGFLGLGAFLTATSFTYRTAPTLRGAWVLENLLCTHIPPPPPDVPELDPPGATGAPSQNVRVRLAEHRTNALCAGCHTVLDPIGLGLENFDAVGKYRTHYPNGDAIDASGTLPEGQSFDGLDQLASVLAADPRLGDCASEKLLTYALGRGMTETDKPYLKQVRQAWAKQGMSLRALLKQIVINDTFRFRRGEVAP